LPDYIVSFTVDPAEWGGKKKKKTLAYDSIQKANYAQLGVMMPDRRSWLQSTPLEL